MSSEGSVKTVSICPGLSEPSMIADTKRSKITFTGSKFLFQHKNIFLKTMYKHIRQSPSFPVILITHQLSTLIEHYYQYLKQFDGLGKQNKHIIKLESLSRYHVAFCASKPKSYVH